MFKKLLRFIPDAAGLHPWSLGGCHSAQNGGALPGSPSTLLPGSADPGLPAPRLPGVVMWVLGLTGAACQAQLPWLGALPPSGASELWKPAGYRG